MGRNRQKLAKTGTETGVNGQKRGNTGGNRRKWAELGRKGVGMGGNERKWMETGGDRRKQAVAS